MPSPTPRCSSYSKESLRVSLDYGRQLYLYIYIYIYIYNVWKTDTQREKDMEYVYTHVCLTSISFIMMCVVWERSRVCICVSVFVCVCVCVRERERERKENKREWEIEIWNIHTHLNVFHYEKERESLKERWDIYIYIYIYIRGAFNTFPGFFVQAFKIVVDSWKFTMLLLYILWNDWPIFYDFRFKWTATAAIGIHPTDCHCWRISKIQSGRESTLEERYAIKSCFKLGKYVTET